MYYVKASDANCIQIDSVEVLAQSINIDIFGNDLCVGDTALVGVINLTPSVSIASYNWNVNSLDTAIIVDVPATSKWYSVEVVDAESCIVKDSVFVNVYEYPIIDSIWATKTSIFKGEEITLNVITNDSINWFNFFTSNTSQNVFPEETKCYVFEVFNAFNCIVMDSICIKVNDVYCDDKNIIIPTAFSPNEDNVNDTYFIQDRDGIVTKYKLEIFNRLGQKVFSSSDILKVWDGKFRGKKLPPQVFDFYLELTCIGEKIFFKKGNITLIK